jgi:hypothetical protein
MLGLMDTRQLYASCCVIHWDIEKIQLGKRLEEIANKKRLLGLFYEGNGRVL